MIRHRSLRSMGLDAECSTPRLCGSSAVHGTGFLHHMVRNLVGTFVEAAYHRISADDIPTILAARNRSAARTAPLRSASAIRAAVSRSRAP